MVSILEGDADNTRHDESLREKIIELHKKYLHLSVSMDDYTSKLKSIIENYIIIIVVDDTATTRHDTLTFDKLGAKETIAFREAYVFVSDRGEITYESKSKRSVSCSLDFKFGKAEIKSCGFNVKELTTFTIENIGDIALNKTGANIVVVDPANGAIIDNVCFDCFHNTAIREKDIVGKAISMDPLTLANDIQKLNDVISSMFQKSSELLYSSVPCKSDDFNTLKREFFISFPKATGRLREVQNNLLLLGKIFCQLCKEAGVQSWVEGGTLIGTVRHNGFVPWDDDIDFSIMYDDFIKLIRFHAASDKYKDFEFNFHHNKSIIMVVFRHKDINFAHFSKLDLFIYTSYGGGEKAMRLLRRRQKIQKPLVSGFLKRHEDSLTKNLVRIKPIEAMDEMNEIISLFRKDVSDGAEDENNKIARVPVFGHSLRVKKMFNFKDIFPLVSHQFEDMEVFIPHNYEDVLSKNFNRWDEIPNRNYMTHFRGNRSDEATLDKMTKWNEKWRESSGEFFG